MLSTVWWLQQTSRVTFFFFSSSRSSLGFANDGNSSAWFRHRFFTLHRYGTGATSFLSPLPRIPLRKCISGERAFSDVTHIQIRTHARTHARITRSFTLTLTRARIHAQTTRARMEPELYRVKGKSVHAGERVCVGYFCFHFHQAPISRTRPNLLSRPPLPPLPLPSPSPSIRGAFSTTSSHVLEYEMRAAIFLLPRRRSTRFHDFTISFDDGWYSNTWIFHRMRRSSFTKIAPRKS